MKNINLEAVKDFQEELGLTDDQAHDLLVGLKRYKKRRKI
jgi:hypothetical protein